MRRFVSALLAFVAVLSVASSCSFNEPEGSADGTKISKIECVMEDFVQDDATKVTTIKSGNNISSTWDEGDVIGVFPDKGGDQVSFTVSGGAGTANCSFNGEGWGLIADATYSAYYPYHTKNYGGVNAWKNIKVSYAGQSQSAKNTFGVGKYDFMACTNAVPSFAEELSGKCTFTFKHLGALLILNVTFPNAAYLSTLELICDSDVFTEAGTVDLSATQSAAAITSTAQGSTLTLDLNGMSVSANETVTFYMMAAPCNMNGAMPTVKATTTSGQEMTKQLTSSYNWRAGRAYTISATLSSPSSATPTLRSTPSAFYPDHQEQNLTLRVVSNQNYTITPTVSWLTKVSETVINASVKEYVYKLNHNNARTSRTGQITLTGETLTKAVSVTQSGFTPSVPVAGDGLTIYTSGGNYQYRYGPSIVMHDSGTIDVWFAAPGHNGKADEFTWRQTSNGGQTWTTEQTVLTGGTKGQDLDWWSVCDPGAAYFDGYYYMAYTSTTNTSSDGGLQGLENDCFIARSTSPSGPWSKWNGSGWGGHPQPIIEYTGTAGKWGLGEPSIVVKDDTVYLYYTWDEGVTAVTKVATAQRSNPNWPGSLTHHGIAVDKAWLAEHDGVTGTALAGSYDSCDVKYVEDYDLFYAFHTSWRITANSRLSVWTSTDGLTFEYLGDVTGTVIKYAHNMGVSGDGLGHVNLSKTQYVSYAYSPANATDRAHGNWNTYWSVLTY